jgi:hypothetical protein
MHHLLEGDRILMIEENVYGVVVSLGAYVSRVRYYIDGTMYDVSVENDAFLVMEEEY